MTNTIEVSYIIGSDAEAVVIDPSVPADVYVDLARRRGWTIRHVLETHIHADHLSRARELARETRAALVLPAQQRTKFPFTAVGDGDRIQVGSATLEVRHTPGHTNESTAYILDKAATRDVDVVGRCVHSRP